MECRCQIINFWLSASKWYACLSMSISNFRRTSNAVCCKVILFQVTGLPLSMKRLRQTDTVISVGLSQPHYAAGWQFDSRCQLARRLVLPSPHHIRNGFTTSVILLPAADGSIARCNYFFLLQYETSWLRLTIMTWMANRLTSATLCTSM